MYPLNILPLPIMNQHINRYCELIISNQPQEPPHQITQTDIARVIEQLSPTTQPYVDNIRSYSDLILSTHGIGISIPIIIYNDNHIEVNPSTSNFSIFEIGYFNRVLSRLGIEGQSMTDVQLPLTSESISKLKETVFSEIKEHDGSKCAICRVPYEQDDKIVQLNCEHLFHKDCIVEWLKEYSHICPVCRKDCGEYKPDCD